MLSINNRTRLLSAGIFAALFALAPIAHAQIGLDFLNLPAGAEIGKILSQFYVFGVSMTVILALIMFTIGGVQYMIAGDHDLGPSKQRMKDALFGLILALTSYLILYTINPDLVREVKLTNIIPISPVPPGTPPSQLPTFKCSADGIEYPTIEQCNTECAKAGGSCANAPPPIIGNWLCESNTNSNGKEFQSEAKCKNSCYNTGNKPGSCTKLE